MSITTFERNASIIEMAVELDRRGAVIESLEAERDRLVRNVEMWKGQVERQADELTKLRADLRSWEITAQRIEEAESNATC